MTNLLRIIALLFAVSATLASAELTYIAKKIVFNNPGPYSQQQLEAAAAMHAGTSFTATDLGAAAQRLVDTGFFENVGATLQGTTKAADVLFDVKPLDKSRMLHVGFENFVWLSHTDVLTAIQEKCPLFDGYLPENSPQQDVIKTALIGALQAKGISSTKVSFDTFEPTMLRPEGVIEFRVDTPELRVANIKLGGVAPGLAPLIQKSVNTTARTPYNEGLAGQTTEDRVLAPLFDAGYIQASLNGVSRAGAPAADGSVAVTLSATLNAADVFHVSSLTFTGAPLLSTDAFAATQKLHPGDVAARSALLETLAPLDAAYRRQGYIDVVVKSSPLIDAATHQVAYTVTVLPGEQYRIHELTVSGLSPEARKDFDRGFTMKTGELYSPEYAATFLKRNTALLALAGYNASFKAYADPNTHTVDLVITFFRAGSR